MILVDTHTHLFLPEFNPDRDEVVQRAIENGVRYMIVPNVDLETIEPLQNLCNKYPKNCFPLIGLHPESIKEDFYTQLEAIEKLLYENKFYGIGETGLDYYWMFLLRNNKKKHLNTRSGLQFKTVYL